MKKYLLAFLMLASLLSFNLALARGGDDSSGSGSSGSGSSSDDSSSSRGSDDSSSGRSSDDSSSSRSSDDSSSSSGFEVETEHGVTFLKPHGVSGGDVARSLGISGSNSLEGFEIETENGVTFMKPHGVSGGDFARALGISDSSNFEGFEVETEHGVTFLKPHNVSRNLSLENRLSGRILLQVQANGEAWWVDPITKGRLFLGRPADAFNIMRQNGLGITNANLAQIARVDDNRASGALARQLAGRILLQVEDNGEAWFVNPVTLKRHFLGRPADAFNVMRSQGLGITNDNLSHIRVRVN